MTQTETEQTKTGIDVDKSTRVHTDDEEADGFVCHLLRGGPEDGRAPEKMMSFCGEYGASGIYASAFRPGCVAGSPRQTPCPVCGRNRCKKCADTVESEL